MTFTSEIIHQEAVTDRIFRIQLKAPEIARTAKPGQFVHVRIHQKWDPLLRRPFSIHRIVPEKDQIVLLYRVVGRGTEIMSRLKSGETVNLMGPLGNGFDLKSEFDRAVVVAGGMGSAPVFFLIDELLKLHKKVIFLWGVREGKEIFEERDLLQKGVDLRIATEDTSKGHCGLVTDLLNDYLSNPDCLPCCGFVCGPDCMIVEVQKLILNGQYRWQASLEERMACGVGVCLGCAVESRKNGYLMVCKDGPVFDLKEIRYHG